MEEVVTLHGHVPPREQGDEPRGFQGVVNLRGSGGGVIERLHELRVDPVDLGSDFLTTTGELRLI